MKKPFTRTFRVRWSELNTNGQVDLAGFFHYVIETAWDWSTANGLSIIESEKLGLVWVIRETEINILRPLYPNERFDFTIWLYKWRRVRGTRFFELRLRDTEEIVAQGAQQIVALDSKTMRPASPPQHLMENFLIENPRAFQQGEIPKVNTPKEGAFISQRDVEWRDLDTLDHVNNAVYAEYAEDSIALALEALGWSPANFKSEDLIMVHDRVHMKYLSSAVWGDKLDVVTSLVELDIMGGAWYIEIKRVSDGAPLIVCLIEWSLINQTSGEKQNLPERLFQTLKERVILPDEDAS